MATSSLRALALVIMTNPLSGTAAAMGAPAGNRRESMKSTKSSHTAATAPRLSLRPVTQFLPGILDNRNSNKSNAPAMPEKPRNNPFGDDKQVPAANPFDEGDGKPASDGAEAAAVSGAGSKNGNNVHRVQLDFKPSMEDEIELKSGQLVRMVHEYDDGWVSLPHMSSHAAITNNTLGSLRPHGPHATRRLPTHVPV